MHPHGVDTGTPSIVICFVVFCRYSISFFFSSEIEGLWQPCMKQVYQDHSSNSMYWLHVSFVPFWESLQNLKLFNYCICFGDLWSVISVPTATCWRLRRQPAFLGMCVCVRSAVSDSATSWAVARQAPLSMEFPKQEYWSEWVAISSSRGSSQSRDWTQVSCVFCIAGGFFTTEPPGKLHYSNEVVFYWGMYVVLLNNAIACLIDYSIIETKLA